jgi:hypothetical protein
MLGLAAHNEPASYWDVIGRGNPRKGDVTVRRAPRRRKTASGMHQDGSDGTKTKGQIHASHGAEARYGPTWDNAISHLAGEAAIVSGQNFTIWVPIS